jgi:3-methyl-2-oxobutanoate hydroxymethyltransferase
MTSSQAPQRPMTVPRFVSAKNDGRRLAVLTAYDYMWARLLDESGVDAILVGDTLGMVVQGRDTTLPVTVEQMIYHGEMVARAARNALVIVDLPFLSYQLSPRDAILNAGRILKETGAAAVKLEGGEGVAETIAALVAADIPVMGHIGMRPQSVRTLGGMSRVERDVDRLLADARAAEQAGAFSIVLELVTAEVAAEVTRSVAIPTIGIGAGAGCDGQILVTQDMLGLTPDFSPRFVKKFANLRQVVGDAVSDYVREVSAGTFPGPEHSH